MTEHEFPLLVCDAVDDLASRWVVEEPPLGVPPVLLVPAHAWAPAAAPLEGHAYRVPYRGGQWIWREMTLDVTATEALRAAVEAQRAAMFKAAWGDDLATSLPMAPIPGVRDDALPLPPVPPHDPEAEDGEDGEEDDFEDLGDTDEGWTA